MRKYIEITVRGFHLDAFGHVNNARYLEFLEEARWEFFGEKIAQVKDQGYSFSIVNTNINYRLPTYLNQKLLVDCRVAKLGNKSIVMTQEILLKETGDIMADALVTSVIVDEKLGKGILLDDNLRKIFAEEVTNTD